MKQSKFIRLILPCICVVLLDLAAGTVIAEVNYLEPSPLYGAIYDKASGTNKVLFSFRRTASLEDKTNDVVRVLRSYLNPDGSIAAVETVVYRQGNLVSFAVDERQTGEHGAVTVSEVTGRKKLNFEWTTGNGGRTKTRNDSETMQPDTLVSDMIPGFICEHWSQLSRGEAVEFRYIEADRLSTYGLRLVKESDATLNGKAVVRLRLEASNFFIARLMDPLFFYIEKDEPHRPLEYMGCTTPKLRDGENWKDFEALSVYDW
jgi:hypothetical protein